MDQLVNSDPFANTSTQAVEEFVQELAKVGTPTEALLRVRQMRDQFQAEADVAVD